MFESAYRPKALNNWELPKGYPSRPRQRKGFTKIIANERGHLLDKSACEIDQNHFGNCLNTYQQPNKISGKFAEKYNDCPLNKVRECAVPRDTDNCNSSCKNLDSAINDLSCPPKYEATEDIFKYTKNRNTLLNSHEKDSSDLEYIPGDLTSFKNQHPTRDLLLEDKYSRDNNIEPDLPLNKNYLGDHKCKLGECEHPVLTSSHLLPQTSALVTSNISPEIGELHVFDRDNIDLNKYSSDFKSAKNMFGSHAITEKPNERCPSPVVPAYANFDLAKRMHSKNLDHQPLPDCVADLAFRKLQITGATPGLALDIEPVATGVGIKTHNAGPTHCTKLKVYRPKTSGVVPRPLPCNTTRSYSAAAEVKKMGPMDLAICWDYKPEYEPPRSTHIDGSKESAGPAVFTCIRSPRDDDIRNTGRSTGVFANTLGEEGFFDKDLLRRKNDFLGRNTRVDDSSTNVDICPDFPRARSVSRDNSACQRLSATNLCKQYKSTPNVFAEEEYKALRNKFLRDDCDIPGRSSEPGCRRSGLFTKSRSRLCHKVSPGLGNCCSSSCPPQRMACKTAFRAGVPRYNAAGNFIDSGNSCTRGNHNLQRVLVIPKPRDPYTKRNYDIDTLVPPFRSFAGGAGEGGYPEHWRLASVYQHAYKPLEYRRKPLLQTVYK